MRFKSGDKGPKISGVRAEIAFIMPVIAKVFADINQECVITSVTDGAHSYGSLHYSGAAVDIRTRHLSEGQKRAVHSRIKSALNSEYDVVLEKTHIHIEFQPKRA